MGRRRPFGRRLPGVSGFEDEAERTAAEAAAAAAVLAQATGADHHDVALVMGSGWVPAADSLGTAEAEVLVTDLPGFAPLAVAGHAGRIRSLSAQGRRVLVF